MAERKKPTITKVSLSEPEQENLPEDPAHKTLRHATLEDVPMILRMARRLYAGSPMEIMRLDYDKAQREIEKAIVVGGAEYLALISYDEDKVVGAIIAYAFSPIFTGDKIAVEVFWYLEPEYRKGRRGLDMMKAYEYWAKLVGCKVAQYGWLVSSPETMQKLYEKTGAKLAEQVYYKELN